MEHPAAVLGFTSPRAGGCSRRSSAVRPRIAAGWPWVTAPIFPNGRVPSPQAAPWPPRQHRREAGFSPQAGDMRGAVAGESLR